MCNKGDLMENQIKVYPFEIDILKKELINKTISPNYINKIKTAYKSGNERVFFGTLKENQFKVYTYPDMSKSFLNPVLFLKRIFIFAAPSCIYGYISECNKQTRIEYTIDKTEAVHIFKMFGIIMCGLMGFMCIIDAFYSGIKVQTFISLGLIFLVIVMLYLLMKIPQSEEDALLKFLEDLGH